MSDTSTFFELLAAGTRRRVLLALCEGEPVSVPEGVTGESAGDTPTANASRGVGPSGGLPDGTGANVDDVRLYHVHLPKLETAGAVDWDRDARTLSRGPAFAEFEPGVRLLAENAELLPGATF